MSAASEGAIPRDDRSSVLPEIRRSAGLSTMAETDAEVIRREAMNFRRKLLL